VATGRQKQLKSSALKLRARGLRAESRPRVVTVDRGGGKINISNDCGVHFRARCDSARKRLQINLQTAEGGGWIRGTASAGGGGGGSGGGAAAAAVTIYELLYLRTKVPSVTRYFVLYRRGQGQEGAPAPCVDRSPVRGMLCSKAIWHLALGPWQGCKVAGV
jgi:hypothetical protein